MKPSSIVRLDSPRGLSLVFVALFSAACGPTVFADASPLVVEGTPPPPPVVEAPAPKRVEVTESAIVIHEKIQFDLDKATIRPESHSLLDEIVSVIKSNPHIHEISIEGHTCDLGSDRHNQQLSDARAAAVRTYLVDHGIAGEMLLSKGWGEAKPLADNSTEDGKIANRRVEFLITKQDEQKKVIYVDPKTGQEVQVAPEEK
jgi:OOP family OmpA-OmpF porin